MELKKLRPVVMLAALVAIKAFAFDPYTDLKNVLPRAQGQCEHNGKTYVCMIVEKEGKHYMVVLGDGLEAVYSVEGVKEVYTEEECKLIWQKNSRRRTDV